MKWLLKEINLTIYKISPLSVEMIADLFVYLLNVRLITAA